MESSRNRIDGNRRLEWRSLGVTLAGFSSFGTAQSVIGNIDNNYQVYDSLKILLGRHEISVGASLHYIRSTQESAKLERARHVGLQQHLQRTTRARCQWTTGSRGRFG